MKEETPDCNRSSRHIEKVAAEMPTMCATKYQLYVNNADMAVMSSAAVMHPDSFLDSIEK